jgi:hypothetical protein
MITTYFELGKSYIVNVTQKGIISLMEFDYSEWYNKDQDDLEFLTDEEKILVINDLLDKIRSEIASIAINGQVDEHTMFIRTGEQVKQMALEIIDKYREKGSDKESEE